MSFIEMKICEVSRMCYRWIMMWEEFYSTQSCQKINLSIVRQNRTVKLWLSKNISLKNSSQFILVTIRLESLRRNNLLRLPEERKTRFRFLGVFSNDVHQIVIDQASKLLNIFWKTLKIKLLDERWMISSWMCRVDPQFLNIGHHWRPTLPTNILSSFKYFPTMSMLLI
jgi:hypothetical protein